MRCAQYQHDNREGAKFCEACGNKLELVCSACGTVLRLGAAFCDSCGTRLGEGEKGKKAKGKQSIRTADRGPRTLDSRASGRAHLG